MFRPASAWSVLVTTALVLFRQWTGPKPKIRHFDRLSWLLETTVLVTIVTSSLIYVHSAVGIVLSIPYDESLH